MRPPALMRSVPADAMGAESQPSIRDGASHEHPPRPVEDIHVRKAVRKGSPPEWGHLDSQRRAPVFVRPEWRSFETHSFTYR